MSKQSRKTPAPVAADAAVAVTPVQAAVVQAVKRLPLPEAQAHNKGNVFVPSGAEAKAADVALTAKGTNPKRARVYGYDNLADGKGSVPKDKRVALVAGVMGTPKGVSDAQWAALTAAVQAAPDATVSTLYAGGIASRTVRRAYRAGAIRFVI
jgi:hypothetical protein